MYIFRKYRSHGSQQTTQGPFEVQYGPTPPHDKPVIPLTQSYHKTGDSTEYYHSTENDYYRTWQIQRHMPQSTPLPAVPSDIHPPSYNFHGAHTSSTQDVTSTGNINNTGYHHDSYSPQQHIYESPKFNRKGFSRGDSGEYYELDQDQDNDS